MKHWIRRFKLWRDAFEASLHLVAMEAMTGVKLIEAVNADEFETQLRTVTMSAAERQDLRDAAIEMGKLGLRREDLEPMARYWHTHPPRCAGDAYEAWRGAKPLNDSR